MKYFGPKSLSSKMSVFLRISWYLGVVAVVLAPLLAGLIIFLSTPTGDAFCGEVARQSCWQKAGVAPVGQNSLVTAQSDFTGDCSGQDQADWESFKRLPLAVKMLIVPYFELVLILLLLIIRKARFLFANFKNDLVFSKANVRLIAQLSKLLIVYSLVTFSFSCLVLSIVLLLLCEIINNGTTLQEELALTV